MQLEGVVERKGPRSFSEAIMVHCLRNKYGVEYACIEEELSQGAKVSTTEFHRRVKAEIDTRKQQELIDLRNRTEQESTNMEMWVEMGGKLT